MPYTIDNVEYLTAQESADFLDMSRTTFHKLRQKEKEKPKDQQLFHEYELTGRGHAVFFRKDELEKFQQTFVKKM